MTRADRTRTPLIHGDLLVLADGGRSSAGVYRFSANPDAPQTLTKIGASAEWAIVVDDLLEVGSGKTPSLGVRSTQRPGATRSLALQRAAQPPSSLTIHNRGYWETSYRPPNGVAEFTELRRLRGDVTEVYWNASGTVQSIDINDSGIWDNPFGSRVCPNNLHVYQYDLAQ